VSRRDRQRLDDIRAVCTVIAGHLKQGDLGQQLIVRRPRPWPGQAWVVAKIVTGNRSRALPTESDSLIARVLADTEVGAASERQLWWNATVP
jgi:hypothetical protein